MALIHPKSDGFTVNTKQWQRENRKYRQLAARFAQALPKRRMTRRFQATWVWQMRIDPSKPAAMKTAIAKLAKAVNERPFRYYVALGLHDHVEHGVCIRGVRLQRYFNYMDGEMVTRIDVGVV